ncbi:GNAT family N-acetyltransferase [Streptomyces sp. NPDC046215]|uniref:GNAT family N-acetyltransferase n=1 Tax=Streptomyces stramineus TaxID=173861 RepID=A0ABN0ZK36_9ACTN
MSPDIRTVTPSDLPDWVRAMRTAFLQPPAPSKQEIETRAAHFVPDRSQGAFDAGRCVATFRSFAQRLTVPGGAQVDVNAISNVTVAPTHRRRGLLSRMMAADLRAAQERGDVAATLISAEYPIYGRYGFGPATSTTEWEVETARSGLDRRGAGPADGGRVDLADAAEVRRLGPALHEEFRARQPGAIDRNELWWQQYTGEVPRGGRPWAEPFFAVYRSPDGTVEGLLTYTSDETWEAKLPQHTLSVTDLLAVSPTAERALWRYLLSVDLAARIRTGLRAPDDILPLLLPEPRAARIVTHADFLWVRPLDVPRLLAARTYATAGSLVLEVADPAGPAGGRFLLEAGPDGAACAPTTRSADLALGAGELGSVCLGDEAVSRLVALGRVAEERPGAAARADSLLRTPRRPWCPDSF